MDGVAARSFEHRGERCRFVRCSSLPLPSRCQNAYGDRPVRNRLPHCLEHLKRKTHCDFPRTRHTYRHVDWKAVIGIDAGGSRARSEAVSARDQYAGRVSQMIRMHLVWMEVLPSASRPSWITQQGLGVATMRDDVGKRKLNVVKVRAGPRGTGFSNSMVQTGKSRWC